MVLPIHLISDSTGETVRSLARACLAQFQARQSREYFWNMQREKNQLDYTFSIIAQNPGLILYSVVDRDLHSYIDQKAQALGLKAVAVLDPTITALSDYLKAEVRGEPGKQHELDENYFRRIDAIHFTLAHDDGANSKTINQAEVILVGVSRTSKTPTSIYLANRGYRVANIPLVYNQPIPAPLLTTTNFIIGLTIDAERLLKIREQRLVSIAQTPQLNYTDPATIQQEIRWARRLCADNNWPVVDVTNRSIEEVAAEVIMVLQTNQNACLLP